MMCSTWKISVFGIVALMLAFGLVGWRCRGAFGRRTRGAYIACQRHAFL